MIAINGGQHWEFSFLNDLAGQTGEFFGIEWVWERLRHRVWNDSIAGLYATASAIRDFRAKTF